MQNLSLRLKWFNFLFAFACGTVVANLWYAVPILSDIAHFLSIPIKDVAIIATITQIGYTVGMFFLVPLIDVFENKKLIVFMVFLNILAIFSIAFLQDLSWLLAMFFFVGLSSSSVQMILPYGASMAPIQNRGASIGTIVSGLLLGIMLARPLSSFLSEIIGWHSIFIVSGVLEMFLLIIFLITLPSKIPAHRSNYFDLIISMVVLFKNTKILRQRGLYHSLAFATFSLFWIVAPLVLIREYGFGNHQVALFALIGVAGAIAAPIAGKIGDRGKTKLATTIALLCVGVSMVLAALPIENRYVAFIWLALCGIVLDFGVSLNLVLSQQILYQLGDQIRARLNALFMTMFFLGGAIGSYLGGLFYAHFGTSAAFLLGGVIGFIAFLLYRFDLRKFVNNLH